TFSAATTSSTATGSGCHGGVDANGLACPSGDAPLVCAEGGDDQGQHGEDCQDGIDARTGAWCDGGPAANGDDGGDDGDKTENEGNDGEADDDAGADPAEARGVSQFNVPAELGCAGSDGEEEDDDAED